MIRPAVPADVPAIAALHERARATYYRGRIPDEQLDSPAERVRWLEGWEQAVARPDGQVLCLVRDGVLAGVASFRTPEGEAADSVMLYQLHVDPERWQQGLGTALHAACVTAWQQAGHTTARLQVYWHNQRARAFYARHDWQPDEAHPPAPDATHITLKLVVPPA